MTSEGHSKDFRDVENPPQKNPSPSERGPNSVAKSGECEHQRYPFVIFH